MMSFIASSLLLLLTAVPALSQVANICPGVCNPNPQGYVQAQTECNQPNLRNICAVENCLSNDAPGFTCTLPENSFIVNNNAFGSFDITVFYSWGQNQTDLDSATGFLNDLAGRGCGDSGQFMVYSGDNRGAAGNETVIVDIEAARLQNLWTDFTSIAARAIWFNTADQGPATMRLFLRDKQSGNIIQGSDLSMAIQPGTGNGCAATPIGFVFITRGAQNTRFMLSTGK